MDTRTVKDHLLAATRTAEDEDALIREVYNELRQMAHYYLRGESDQRTLQTTALVHEAYLKLAGGKDISDKGRAYFFGAAAQAMRQVLVESARRRRRQKRGSGDRPLTLHSIDPSDERHLEQVLWVHETLDGFARKFPRQARVVECRFFGGLSLEETAQVLEVSVRTVKRDWNLAQAWLYREWSN